MLLALMITVTLCHARHGGDDIDAMAHADAAFHAAPLRRQDAATCRAGREYSALPCHDAAPLRRCRLLDFVACRFRFRLSHAATPLMLRLRRYALSLLLTDVTPFTPDGY